MYWRWQHVWGWSEKSKAILEKRQPIEPTSRNKDNGQSHGVTVLLTMPCRVNPFLHANPDGMPSLTAHRELPFEINFPLLTETGFQNFNI